MVYMFFRLDHKLYCYQILFNILETFHMNPRLCLSLQETGDVVMALNQHTAMDPKVIGFTGYPLAPSGKSCLLFNHYIVPYKTF